MTIEQEERGLERRVFELERQMSQVATSAAVTAAKVDGLVTTINSRFTAFDRGIELILQRYTATDDRITALEEVRNKAWGALAFAQIIGITGVIGGIIAIIRLIYNSVVK